MFRVNKDKNKKGIIGTAMTWIVATMIILFLVILFIYSSYTLAKEKDVSSFEVTKLLDKKSFGADSEQVLLALLKTEIDKEPVLYYIHLGEYSKVEGSVNRILERMPEIKGEAVAYTTDKEIKLKDNVLSVEND